MNKKVLLIYSVNENTGLSAKVKKIEQGFLAAGCQLDRVYVKDQPSFTKKIVNLFSTSMQVFKLIKQNDYEVIYIRYLYYFLPFFLMLMACKKQYQIEINNNNRASLLNRGQHFRAWVDGKLAGLILNNAKAAHVVTYELADYYQGAYPKSHVVYTPNFVVDEYYNGEPARATDGKVNLVFLGNTEQSWHGIEHFVEKVIVGSNWFSDSCVFHIVGRCSMGINSLVQAHGLDNIVVQHGFVSGDEKYKIINNMDIGLGCFSLHLAGLKEATAIKTAEYFYSGLHVMLGAPDSRLSSVLPFYLCVDLHSALCEAEVEKIKNFVADFTAIKCPRLEPHSYAKQHLLVGGYIDIILKERG